MDYFIFHTDVQKPYKSKTARPIWHKALFSRHPSNIDIRSRHKILSRYANDWI